MSLIQIRHLTFRYDGGTEDIFQVSIYSWTAVGVWAWLAETAVEKPHFCTC